MKKILFLTTLLLAGIGSVYVYQNNIEFKSKVDNWIRNAESGSTTKPVLRDTLPQKAQQPPVKREKIPKKLKPDKFDKLDQYARNAPEKYSADLRTLADYLVIPAKNDLEKARLLYTWIATHIKYDDEAYNTGEYEKNDPTASGILQRKTGVCDDYSTLYMELGRMMDLEVEKIIGYAKGYGYKPGDKFSETNHAWNVIKINHQWKLVDVTWGSGSGTTKDNKLVSTSRFDPYWFCVEPKEFIFRHLPEETHWQLTNSFITLAQYEDLPYLDETFFKLGFNGEEAFKSALSGSVKEFVKTYPVGFPVKVIGLPFYKTLTRGEKYIFTLQSDYIEEAAIINSGQWIYLQKENNEFKAEFIPLSDRVKICIKINWFDKNFWTAVEYTVDDPKNL
jgi:hypothetical protein